MPYRVIQWATGNVGRYALPAILRDPRLELVGLVVYSEEKAGRDAGELCGLPPTGVMATTDADAALGVDADVVSYTATGDLRPDDAVADMCRSLESGKNVVSTSVVPLVYPPSADERLVGPLEEACRKGATSCFTSGIDPGFANDLLPIALMSACERIDSVRVAEILNYDTYDQADVLFGTMGFGQPLDSTPLLLTPGVLTIAWGAIVHVLAAARGLELDEVREIHERRPAVSTFEIPSGTVEAGTTAALRFEVQGVVDGQPMFVVEHVTRLQDDLVPEWPHLGDHGGYLVQIDGSPRMRCELSLEGEDGDHNTGGLVATAARILNAIPAVCAAEPGVLSALDLPIAAT